MFAPTTQPRFKPAPWAKKKPIAPIGLPKYGMAGSAAPVRSMTSSIASRVGAMPYSTTLTGPTPSRTTARTSAPYDETIFDPEVDYEDADELRKLWGQRRGEFAQQGMDLLQRLMSGEMSMSQAEAMRAAARGANANYGRMTGSQGGNLASAMMKGMQGQKLGADIAGVKRREQEDIMNLGLSMMPADRERILSPRVPGEDPFARDGRSDRDWRDVMYRGSGGTTGTNPGGSTYPGRTTTTPGGSTSGGYTPMDMADLYAAQKKNLMGKLSNEDWMLQHKMALMQRLASDPKSAELMNPAMLKLFGLESLANPDYFWRDGKRYLRPGAPVPGGGMPAGWGRPKGPSWGRTPPRSY